MTKYLVVVFLAITTVAIFGCNVSASSPQLQDQQIVCSLKGEAFIFIEGYEKSIHSVRSIESDALCQPLKAFIAVKPSAAPASGASQ